MLLCPLLLALRPPTAAEVRARADRLVAAGRLSEASSAFFEASRKYAALGDPNAAQILRDYGRRYQSDLRLYVDDLPPQAESLARNEPSAGCYLGVNVEREDGAERDPGQFERAIGRDHALFFTYRSFGQPFPVAYARNLRRLGAGLQIAWEPQNLSQTEDAPYLERFLRDAAASGIPVYLRFASEMNGDWTPYHADPAAYREAFRRVATMAHALAKNAAMVWCPADSPEIGLDAYWPGDDAVDWVGVNFYSVLYNDGNRGRAAAWRHPEDSLDYVYRRYATKHPMMVGEWAATHRSVVDPDARPDFAVDKILQFYAAVPRIYPRVKAVHWLSLDTMRYASGPRRLNDFTLLSDASVAAAYRIATEEPFYLGHVDNEARSAPRPLKEGDRFDRPFDLSAYVRTYVARPRVVIKLDGKAILDQKAAGAYRVQVDAPTGRHSLVLAIYDDAGRLAGRQAVTVEKA